ncbi:MAG TPA: hypothetical protein VEW74_01550 [Candidatus Nitrosotalea sp.]|nr:hypothetical protein [Candidatus Nitrosotalea sp.]
MRRSEDLFRSKFCRVETSARKRGKLMQDYDAFETEIYYDREPAATAVERLHELGYRSDDISVMMSDKTRERAFGELVKAKGSEGLATGATIGGILGAIAAGLTATGAVVTTGGLAAPLVVGPLAAALAGLGVGAAGGGIVGSLIGVGIGEKKAKEYEQGLRDGGILVAVKPKSSEHRDEVRRAMTADSTRVNAAERGNIAADRGESNVEYAGETGSTRRDVR